MDIFQKYLQTPMRIKKNKNKRIKENLLETIIEGFVNEEPLKAVKKDTNRVVTYTNKDNYDAAIKQGTHRPFNPATDKDLPMDGEPSGGDQPDLDQVAKDLKRADGPTVLRPDQQRKPIPGEPGFRRPGQPLGIDIGPLMGKVDVESRNSANESLGGPKNRQMIPQPISLDEITEILGDEADKISPVYLEAMVDIINTGRKTKGWLVSDFLKRSGAGQPASQAGEILATLHLALSEEKSSALHQFLTERYNKESVVDASWVKAARNNSIAFRRYLDMRHGAGEWSVESVAWDVPDEVKAIGVDYSQTEPSTDTFVRVNTPNGSEIEQISLKKDKKVNFLNLSTGQFEEAIIRAEDRDGKYSKLLDKAYARLEQCEDIKMDSDNKTKTAKAACRKQANDLIEKLSDRAFKILGIPPELSGRKAAKQEAKIHREGIEKHSDTMKQMAAKIAGEDCPSDTLEKIEKQMDAKGSIRDNCKKYKILFGLIAEHQGSLSLDEIKKLNKAAGFDMTLRQAQKSSLVLAAVAHEELPESGGGALHKDIYEKASDHSRQHSQSLIDWMMDTDTGRKTVNRIIRDRMPLRGVVEGKEAMLIGDVHFTREDAAELFGTDNFDEISERLVSVPPPPAPRIEYQIEGTDEKFTVAKLVSRPDGIGYGQTWRLDLSLDAEFEKNLREVNKRRQSSQQPQESAPPELRKLIRDIALWKLGKYGN